MSFILCYVSLYPKFSGNLTYTCMTGTKWSPGPAFFCHCTHLCSSWRIFLYLRLSFAMRNSIFGAALCKNRPQACKIKMSKILIKCPNVGLCGPWMGKILKSPADFYFRRKMQFCVYTLNDHDLRPFQHTSEKNSKKILVLFHTNTIYIEEKNDNFAAFIVLNFWIWTDFEYFTEF
jgi:hypothetical protein